MKKLKYWLLGRKLYIEIPEFKISIPINSKHCNIIEIAIAISKNLEVETLVYDEDFNFIARFNKKNYQK